VYICRSFLIFITRCLSKYCSLKKGISCSVNKDATLSAEGEPEKREKKCSIYYQGLRHGLEMHHELRSKGQTRACCVKSYYSEHGLEEKKNKAAKEISSRLDINNIDSLQFCLPVTERDELITFLRQQKKYWTWHRYDDVAGGYSIHDFDGNLFFPHCDYRVKVDYSKGITDSEYLTAGLAVMQKKKKKETASAIRENYGVYGVWAFVFLNYSNYQLHAQFGAMHSLSGMCKMFFSFISHEKADLSRNMKKYLKQRNLHPYCNDQRPYIPWCLKARDETAFDCTLASILRPIGLHEGKAPKCLYQRKGHLKCAEVIQIFAYFLPFLVSEVGDHFGSAYKAFFCMMANNVRGIIAHSMTAAQMNYLQDRYELCSCNRILCSFIHKCFYPVFFRQCR